MGLIVSDDSKTILTFFQCKTVPPEVLGTKLDMILKTLESTW